MPMPQMFHGWLTAQAIPLLLLAGFLGLGALMLALSAWKRRSHLQHARAGESVETFAERMRFQGFDPELSRLVYNYLTQHEGVNFPVRPRDILDEDLGLSAEHVQAMLAWVLSASDRQYTAGISDAPVFTVADVVRVVQHSPRRERLAA